MKKILVILTLLFVGFTQAQETGTVAGRLLDKESNNQPLPFANVLVAGTSKGTSTDFDGLFEIPNVPAGTYTIEFSFTGYQTVQIPNVQVIAGQVAVVDATMGATAAALEEVIIKVVTNKEREEALLLEQKNAVEIKQAIGAEELSRKGIGNVEQAVTKASGITKVASRGIFVRGLDERYNFLTLNNLPISPVNWETKTPSLDLFDASIIKNIDINKIFYTSLYGDFAGATINVNTKAIPSKAYTKISFSAGVNLQSLDNDFITDKEDDKLYYFGFGGLDARSIPNGLSNSNVNDPNVFEISGQDAIAAFESDWNTEEVDTPIALSTTIENAGILTNNDERKTAYYVSANYGNSFNSKIGNSVLRNPVGGLVRRIDRANDFDFQTNSSMLFSVFDKAEKNTMAFNYLFLRTTSNNVSDNFGRYTEVAANLQGIDSRFQQSTLNQYQIVGAYEFNDDKLNYGATYGNSNFAQPDNNVITLEEVNTGDFVFANNSGRLYKYYLDNESDNFAASLSYDLNYFGSQSENVNTLKFGVDYNTERLDIYNRFVLLNTDIGQVSVDVNDLDASIDQLLLNDLAEYNELVDTRFLDIKTNIIAGYLNYNYNFSDKWSVQFGARLENFTRTVGEESQATPEFEFDELFILPSFNVRYAINDKSNLRFAGSKTYTRPKNIEISSITRQNSIGDLITGNPNLENSDNYNIDLKYEIFPYNKTLFSVNGFFKYIDSPIERLVADNESFIQTVFRNTDEAIVYGAELELRAPLGFIVGNEALDNIIFGTNFTLMQSETNISEELQNQLNLTNDERRLQGASDMLLNADITYATNFSETFESEFTLTFNTYSKRISAVGSGASTVTYEDEFEKPFNNLSFIWKNNINDKIGTSLKVNNILDDTYERSIESGTGLFSGDVSNVSYTIGRSISLSLSYTF